ncbi:hypothetical protein M3B43_07420 [Nesterenkonia massiliensis]|uniref:Tail terminator n=1 Tax=Nesterenkonia massiliensis TaxID=1232429 RepID=A0ABT2HR61_9MICC|nr:hypothetical protein [Nesterenkonia massiliensis]MCT1607157.1 hypothetical protein [Nesterenkonia massiliensis]
MVMVPADIEHITNTWIQARYAALGWGQVPVSTTLPPSGESFVVAFTTGGQDRTLVSGEDRIVFDCYGPREAPAQQLSARIFALVKDLDSRLIDGVQFYDVTPTKPANYPDPRKPDLFRYQFNALIHARYLPGA